MKSEIHVTYDKNAFDHEKFKKLGYDPQIWHMNLIKPQFMLTFPNYDVFNFFSDKNPKPIRIKEEVELEGSDGYQFLYAEAHMNVYVPVIKVEEFCDILYDNKEFSLSQNILAHPTKFCLTERVYKKTENNIWFTEEYQFNLPQLKRELKNFITDDIVYEGCIRDTNENLDAPWIVRPS